MSVVTDTCALCLQKRALRDSHLIPAAILRSLRDETFKNPNPYIMSLEHVGQSSAQAKQYLLCHDCEQRFNRGGEKWIAANCYRPNENVFPVRDAVKRAQPLLSGPHGSAYDASRISSIDIEKLGYFGGSVIWRASLRPWRLQKQMYRPIEICPRHKEELRSFLLGGSFPQDAALAVYIPTFDPPPLMVCFPESLADNSIREYRFYIPGFWFLLFFGEKLSDEHRKWCILRSPFHPICSYAGADALLGQIGLNLYKNQWNR